MPGLATHLAFQPKPSKEGVKRRGTHHNRPGSVAQNPRESGRRSPQASDPNDETRLATAHDEQAIIARIRQPHKNGGGLPEITRSLDRAGIDCRGGRWSHTTIASVLRRAGQLAETG
jgi:hypothetical protein